jgi:F-type H+-transporting ATPase subunit delta
MVSVAANRYARALLWVVLEPGSGLEPRDVVRQLGDMESLFAESDELRHVMMSPAVAGVRKRGVLAQIANQLGLAPKIRNFFYVLVDHRRIGQIAEIREAFEESLDAALGFVHADVTSAQPLTDEQRQALQAELAKVTGKQIRMEPKVDPALVGGVIARIGSTVYDGSVRGRLESLRQRLATQA